MRLVIQIKYQILWHFNCRKKDIRKKKRLVTATTTQYKKEKKKRNREYLWNYVELFQRLFFLRKEYLHSNCLPKLEFLSQNIPLSAV